MYRVLFVDDDPQILAINRAYFEPRGWQVDTAPGAAQALELVRSHPYDCIVLDIIMPNGEDGYQLCRDIRTACDTPILFLTSLTDQEFLYRGFACGGDDYLTKPYDLKELCLRVEARANRIRQAGKHQSEKLSFPPMEIDLTSRRLTIDGQPIVLTGGEFDILSLLCTSPNQVFSPEEIYSRVWKMPGLESTHTVQVHVSRLRRKLEAAWPDHKFIQTVWGKGYLFAPAPR